MKRFSDDRDKCRGRMGSGVFFGQPAYHHDTGLTEKDSRPRRARKKHITSTPDTCGGKARIDGTRIRVQDIYVWHEIQGRTPDEIVDQFPHLTLANVHAALAYFFDHREEILRDVHDDADYVANVKAQLRAHGNTSFAQLQGMIVFL